MAVTGVSFFPTSLSPVIRRDFTPSVEMFSKSNPISFRRLAVSTEQTQTPTPTTTATPTPTPTRRLSEKSEELGEAGVAASDDEVEQNGRVLKEYFERSKELISRSDGGPPRWFTPLECGPPLKNSPLLLFLPGFLRHGACTFLSWIEHHLQLVEKTIRSENNHSPNRPIYLVGESFGGCLALAVAASNPDIDLVLILANPATSISRSQLQPLMTLLEFIPDQLPFNPPNMLSLMTVGELSQDLDAISSYLSVLADILPRETLRWKLQMLKSGSAFSNSRLHAVKAQTLILSSGRDQLLLSQEEGERLCHVLPKCEIRKFNNSGHFLLLEDGIDLVTIIKGAGFYRRGKYLDYVSDYMLPTPTEFKKVAEDNKWIGAFTSPVMLSTLEDGKIVRGLAGIPSEGPVLLVGYHMLLGIELAPLVANIFRERNILVRGIAHPMMFVKKDNTREMLPDVSQFDTHRIMGAVPVSASNLFKLLSSKSHVLLYPGGMREALHRKGEEYKLLWPEQSEFVRMAARFGAKIIPFGAVGEDDISEVVFDYDDLMKIPYFKNQIEKLTSEAGNIRADTTGEVANQDVHLPGILPKFPGRFYYYFGKPIETEGMKQELKDRDKAHELYLQVKSEVGRCIAYLKEKRESDPYRNLLSRLIYQTTQGFTSEIPTFKL
ncbi:acyltransferase-like protein [Quercus suber]|uniref:Acyltransferase-like protein n=1 Tax=Quercus suber TaxID=58331 RepID=A0AAW0JJ54_QUESU